MTPERLRRVQVLFEQAVEMSGERQRQFLADRCGDDGELRSAVDALLASDDTDDRFLAHPASRPATPALVPPWLPTENGRIGPYELVAQIGWGGMSAVFLAENRDSEESEEVAIKIVRQDLEQDAALERFRDEQRILAGLDHPYIARLLDAGQTESGLPFFVLEYVEGLAITDFCDSRSLPIDDRIELLRQVCEAVHYAHQNLVVHRDLKPRNILVDDAGRPRLLDFGIAKLLDPTGGADPTESSSRVLTPSYAAPELFVGGRVTTGADVYSLGVLLYELLTGTRPYEWRGLSPTEVLQRWERRPPLPPSVVALGAADSRGDKRGADEACQAAAGKRRMTPAALSRRLAGDLDNITLRALRFEVQERFCSVQELAADLRRHLDGMPVTARPATPLYRLGKFLRRHLVAVANTAAIVLLLAGLVVLGSVQASRLRHERDLAERQRSRAESATRFLVDTMRLADPASGLGEHITARELLLSGAQRIDSELGDDPETRASLEHTLGSVYVGLGLFADARRHLEQALLLRREHFGDRDLSVAETLYETASLLAWTGDLEAGERAARESLAIRRELLGESHLEIGRSLRQLSGLLVDLARFDEAQERVRAALAMHRQLFGERHREVALDLTALARVQLEAGEYAVAAATAQQALEVGRSVFAPDSTVIGRLLTQLGTAVRRVGRLGEAEAHYREALQLYEGQLGAEHPATAAALNNLGGLMVSQAKYDAAESLQRQSIERLRSRLGDAHPNVGRAVANLGVVLLAARRLEEAEPHFRRALAIHRHLGDAHPLVGEDLQHLGSTLFLLGDLDAAEAALAEALAVRSASLGERHDRTAETHTILGRVLRELGRLDEAEAQFRAALLGFRSARGEDHWLTAIGLMRVAEVLVDRGEAAEAERLAGQARRVFERSPEPAHLMRAAEARGILGSALSSLGRLEEAEVELRASHDALRAAKGEHAKQTHEAALRLAAHYVRWGRPAEAERILPAAAER